MRLFCKPCSDRGHFCETENVVDGIAICVFCEDGVACPVAERQLKKAKEDGARNGFKASAPKDLILPKPVPVPPNYGSHYMQKLAHQYAQRMGFRVKTRVRAGELYLQRDCASGGRAKKGRAA